MFNLIKVVEHFTNNAPILYVAPHQDDEFTLNGETHRYGGLIVPRIGAVVRDIQGNSGVVTMVRWLCETDSVLVYSITLEGIDPRITAITQGASNHKRFAVHVAGRQ